MAATKPCPVCGAAVKLANLEGHVQRVHPGVDVDLSLSKEERRVLVRQAAPARPQVSQTGRKWALVFVVIIVAVLLVALLYRPNAAGPGPAPGGDAPNFTVSPVGGGGPITLSALTGQVVLLDFMDTDCSHCQAHTPGVLVPLFEEFGSQVFFLSIDVGWVGAQDTENDVLQFKDQYGATWTYALDLQNIDDLYGVTGTPTTVLIDQQGNIYKVYNGEESLSVIANDIRTLLG